MKTTMKQRAADEILAQHREAARQRSKAYRKRKRATNQSPRHVTQTDDDPLAAARRFVAELEARRNGK